MDVGLGNSHSECVAGKLRRLETGEWDHCGGGSLHCHGAESKRARREPHQAPIVQLSDDDEGYRRVAGFQVHALDRTKILLYS